jgi:hypothetical protein
MQSHNSEVTIRRAGFNDYREIYKLLGLIHYDFLLVILLLVFIYFAALTFLNRPILNSQIRNFGEISVIASDHNAVD